MNERLQKIMLKVRNHSYEKYLQEKTLSIAQDFCDRDYDIYKRSAERLRILLEAEIPHVFPEDRIALIRTVRDIPPIFTDTEWKDISSSHFICESGEVFNICSDYETLIKDGFGVKKQRILNQLESLRSIDDSESINFLKAALDTILASEAFIKRYRKEAQKVGNTAVFDILSHIPEEGARSFHEALQFFRIINYILWLNGNYHNTLGRFDQYLYPYFKHDIETGVLTEEAAYDLIVETFLSLNKDSRLYKGVQQGDNGQSMVLGGCDASGNQAFNRLTELCMRASLEIEMIDPKINLRVSKDTDDSWFIKGTELTKAGLGFPQYSNDDVVIKALTNWGYALQDARNYVVAACWEFIIPGKGMDIPNIDAVNLPNLLNEIVYEELTDIQTFEDLMRRFTDKIELAVDAMVETHKNIYITPSPFQSVCMNGCIENCSDICNGSTYNNYGIHGSGISTVVDSLYALKTLIYEQKSMSPSFMQEMLKHNYIGYEKHRNEILKLKKMGDIDETLTLLCEEVIDIFSNALATKQNERKGIYRPGTGTAMYYIWHAQSLRATADGRKDGQPFPANFSPSLIKRHPGFLSVVKSFVPSNIYKAANGGPLTIEVHKTVFKNREGIIKTAQLVHFFIEFGGHQLQINTLDKETLLQAQEHPENYKNLIVRVWGWSGYFTELDKEFQDHIIQRNEYGE